MESNKAVVRNGALANCKPFQRLSANDSVDYGEQGGAENSFNLMEGTVDVALVPCIEYAQNGDLVGLDYGLGYSKSSSRLFLYANSDVRKLHTIYFYEERSTSIILLRLLLSERWGVSPRLIPLKEMIPLEALKEREGLLYFQTEAALSVKTACPIVIDLVSEWNEWTGLPFVFLVWAARSEIILGSKGKIVDDAIKWLVEDSPETMSIDSSNTDEEFYRFDEAAKKGIDLFFDLCAKKGLVAPTTYINKELFMTPKVQKLAAKYRSTDYLLQAALEGQRLSYQDARFLANKASLDDLGLAADLLRDRLYSKRNVHIAHTVMESHYNTGKNDPQEALLAVARRLASGGYDKIVFKPDLENLRPFEEYVELLDTFSQQLGLRVEGFGVATLLKMAEAYEQPLEKIVRGLVEVGLDVVSSWGGGLLMARSMVRRGFKDLTARDWLRTIRQVHRFGAKSSCSLRVCASDSWEERLIHLHKLRRLQDVTRGIAFFCVKPAVNPKDQVSSELLLRSVAIGRLFLDNVTSIEEVRFRSNGLSGVMSLMFGANSIRVKAFPGEEEVCQRAVQGMKGVGLSILSDDNIPVFKDIRFGEQEQQGWL